MSTYSINIIKLSQYQHYYYYPLQLYDKTLKMHYLPMRGHFYSEESVVFTCINLSLLVHVS